jgi:hypothetical protein
MGKNKAGQLLFLFLPGAIERRGRIAREKPETRSQHNQNNHARGPLPGQLAPAAAICNPANLDFHFSRQTAATAGVTFEPLDFQTNRQCADDEKGLYNRARADRLSGSL